MRVLEAQGLTRPAIQQPVFDAGELMASDGAEGCAPRTTGAGQAVGVSIAASPAGTVGMAQDVDLRLFGQRWVPGHLKNPAASRCRTIRLGHRLRAPHGALEQQMGATVVPLHRPHVAARMLDRHAHGQAAHRAVEQNTRTAARHNVHIHLRRTLRNRRHVFDGVQSHLAAAARPARLAPSAHQPDEFAAGQRIDGLARDAQRTVRGPTRVSLQPVGHLQNALHVPARRVQVRDELALRLPPSAPPGRPNARSIKPVAAIWRNAALAMPEFGADRRALSLQPVGRRTSAVPLRAPRRGATAGGHGQPVLATFHTSLALLNARCGTSTWSRSTPPERVWMQPKACPLNSMTDRVARRRPPGTDLTEESAAPSSKEFTSRLAVVLRPCQAP